MPIKIIKAEAEVREEDSRELKDTVQSVINSIRNEGDKGVSEFTKKFDFFRSPSYCQIDDKQYSCK